MWKDRRVCVKCVNHLVVRGEALSRIDRWRLFRGQVVVEDRPRFADTCTQIHPFLVVILHRPVKCQVTPVYSCTLNINELQGGPKMGLRDEKERERESSSSRSSATLFTLERWIGHEPPPAGFCE